MSLDLKNFRICVTGGAGFLGRFVCEALKQRGVSDDQLFIPRRKDYDLTHEADVARLYDDAKPDVMIHLAAEVGGIGANREHPGRFFFANMAMGMHLIEQARIHMIRGEYEWHMTIKASLMEFRSVKVPKTMDGADEGDDPEAVEGRLLDRIGLLETVYKTFDELLGQFIKIRISNQWVDEATKISSWIHKSDN